MSSHVSKIALALQKYKPPIQTPVSKSMSQQMNAYFGLGDFHWEGYQHLSENLETGNSIYRTASASERKQLAKAQVDLWHNYIRNRQLPESFQIPSEGKDKLEKVWKKMLYRNESTIAPSRILEFHSEFIQHYPYNFPLDDKSLLEMIHPHFGYLCQMFKSISFQELIAFYDVQSVACYERSLGEEILAKQISAFNYWRMIDTQAQGWVGLQEFLMLLRTLKFSEIQGHDEICEYFKWTLEEHLPHEFAAGEIIYRFQFIRQIFLDFNL